MEEENKRRKDPVARTSMQPASNRSPNTSQQLGKYITDGLELLSLSDMKIVLHKDDSLLRSEADNSAFVFDEMSHIDAPDDEDHVYLANIYETYSKLDRKVELLLGREYFDKAFVKLIYGLICRGEYRAARESILRELEDRDPMFEREKYVLREVIDSELVESKLLPALGAAKEEMLAIEETKMRLEKAFFSLREVHLRSNLESAKRNAELMSERDRCSMELEKMRRDYARTYEELRDMLEYSTEGLDEPRLLKELRASVEHARSKLQRLEEENAGLRTKTREMEGVKDIENTLGAARREIQKLQDENLTFSDAINKLNERNIRLKKDCVMLNDALKKAVDSSKRKGSTIEKQRRMIEILQSKVGTSPALPLVELREKIDGLRDRIENETDLDSRKVLVDEVADYEKRMADFLSIAR
jgi:hypothetical protein